LETKVLEEHDAFFFCVEMRRARMLMGDTVFGEGSSQEHRILVNQCHGKRGVGEG
jgi:3-isopropylmalate dehydratase small subunit